MSALRIAVMVVTALLSVACSGERGGSDTAMTSGDQSAPLENADDVSTPSLPTEQAQPAASSLIAGQAPRKGAGLPPGALRVQMVEIMDTNGFDRPMPASFAFVPTGWRTSGGVVWGQQFACTNGFNYNWMAQSPDATQTVAIIPQQKWEANNYGAAPSLPGCQNASITSIQQYLQQVVSSLRAGARVTNFRPRPDLAAKFRHLNAATPSPMGEMRTWVESGEALFAYSESGRSMQGVIAATAVFSLMRNSALGNGQTMDALTGFVFPGFVATAPEGQLNRSFAEAIRQSFLPNPAWEARIAQHNTAIFRSAQAEIRKQSQMISEYNDYVSRIRQETADMRAQSDTRRQREFGEAMKGTETYDDPNAPGGQVELSNMYNHAWRLNDGTYVLSDDASFEPFRDLGLDGKRLGATR